MIETSNMTLRHGKPRRRFSGWTVVVPIVLAICIYVVVTIVGDTRWTLHPHRAAHTTSTPAVVTTPARWYVVHPGDTWRSVAARTHVPVAQLHLLNPRDTARGKVVAGERLLLLRTGT
jgi:LysM repeat protein